MKNYNRFKNKFKKYQKMEIYEQKKNKVEIIELFKEFWDSNPTEDEFDECIKLIILFPPMLYYMIKNKNEVLK